MLVWRSPDELMEGNTSNLSFFIICVFGILLNIIMIVVFQRGNKKIQLEYRIQVLEDNRKLSKAHFMELREAYRKIERMAHDMKQHLNYLEAAPDIERVQSYIFKLKEKSFSHVLRFTGNFDIDVILNSKHHEAEKEKIILRVSETALPPVIDWLDPVDINIILGNALSNAIEACIIAEGNEINIALKYGDGWLKITITNPSVEPIGSKRNGAGLITTKAGGLHGLGMESMAAAAENYDGLMRYKYENGVFTMDILLQRR